MVGSKIILGAEHLREHYNVSNVSKHNPTLSLSNDYKFLNMFDTKSLKRVVSQMLLGV